MKSEQEIKELLNEAKKRFPVGTKFMSWSEPGVVRTVERDSHYVIDKSNVLCGETPKDEWSEKHNSPSNPHIYKDGEWAKIFNEPKPKKEPKITIKSKEVSVSVGDAEVWGVVRNSGFDFGGERRRRWEGTATRQELRDLAECWIEMAKCVENFKNEEHE